MSIKSFRKPPLNESQVVALAAAVDDYVRPLTANPILDFRIIEQVPITSSTSYVIKVAHGLGRPWKGWWIVRQSANRTVWESSTQPPSDTYISLTASGACTVDIYIF